MQLTAPIDLLSYGVVDVHNVSAVNTTAIILKFDVNAIAVQLAISLNISGTTTIQIINITLVYVVTTKRDDGQWNIVLLLLINSTKSFDTLQQVVADLIQQVAAGTLDLGITGVGAPTDVIVESYEVTSQPIASTTSTSASPATTTTKGGIANLSSGYKLAHSSLLLLAFVIYALFM